MFTLLVTLAVVVAAVVVTLALALGEPDQPATLGRRPRRSPGRLGPRPLPDDLSVDPDAELVSRLGPAEAAPAEAAVKTGLSLAMAMFVLAVVAAAAAGGMILAGALAVERLFR